MSQQLRVSSQKSSTDKPTQKPQTASMPEVNAPLPSGHGHDFRKIAIFPKLEVNAPGDQYEREADQTATQVVARIALANQSAVQREDEEENLQRKALDASTLSATQSLSEEKVQTKPETSLLKIVQRIHAPEEDKELQRKPLIQRAPADGGFSVEPEVEQQIEGARSGGALLSGEVRGSMESAFGADFSRVRVHTDGPSDALNRSLQARAFTTGSDIFFKSGEYRPGSQQGQELLAHELTHVVQQGGSKAPAQSDHSESPVQRFGSEEHRQIGDAASGGQVLDIDLGDGTKLTYGEMVALAGDFYPDLASIRTDASTPEGQVRLRWTRWFALHQGSEPSLDDDSKKAIRDRYYRLASQNFSHFSAGGTARNEYERMHQEALGSAFAAGATGLGNKWPEALASEAFSNHYLTDMFAGGHVRTPRQQIKAWYQSTYPDSLQSFVTYAAETMTQDLDAQGDIPGYWPNSSVRDKLKARIMALGGSAMATFTLGDIVSLAFHNHDNAGLGVISDVGPDGSPGPFHWTAKGDGHLADGEESSDQNPVCRASITRQMVTAAVRVSLNELNLMREAGMQASHGTCLSPEAMETALRAAINPLQPFEAGKYIPREDPDANNDQMNWKWGQIDPVLRTAIDEAVKGEIAGTLRGKAGEVPEVIRLTRLGKEDPSGAVVLHTRTAFNNFVGKLASQGITAMEAAMSTPAAQPATSPLDENYSVPTDSPDASIPDATVVPTPAPAPIPAPTP